MPKLPFMRFYPADYLLATRALTDTEKAIWMDLLCYMWLQPTNRGRLEMHIEDMARLVGREKSTLQITLESLKKKEICDLENREDQTVFVECRRMVRDDKGLKMNRLRQRRYNAMNNGVYNAAPNKKITPKKSEVRRQKTDKDSLIDSPEKPIESPPPPKRQLTDVQKVMVVFKMALGHDKDDKEWDRMYFERYATPAKRLIEFMGGNWEWAADCIQETVERLGAKGFQLLKLHSILDHAAEWKKDRLEMEARRGVLPVPSYGN